MKQIRTWVLVADGGRARVLQYQGPGTGLSEVPGAAERWSLPPSRDIGTDRPGRSFDSHGDARHALQPTSDPHRELKRAFARHLARELDEQRAHGAFDQLVLVAPPAFLGDLRAALPNALAGMVCGELAKDLTKVPDQELAEHLVGLVL